MGEKSQTHWITGIEFCKHQDCRGVIKDGICVKCGKGKDMNDQDLKDIIDILDMKQEAYRPALKKRGKVSKVKECKFCGNPFIGKIDYCSELCELMAEQAKDKVSNRQYPKIVGKAIIEVEPDEPNGYVHLQKIVDSSCEIEKPKPKKTLDMLIKAMIKVGASEKFVASVFGITQQGVNYINNKSA